MGYAWSRAVQVEYYTKQLLEIPIAKAPDQPFTISAILPDAVVGAIGTYSITVWAITANQDEHIVSIRLGNQQQGEANGLTSVLYFNNCGGSLSEDRVYIKTNPNPKESATPPREAVLKEAMQAAVIAGGLNAACSFISDDNLNEAAKAFLAKLLGQRRLSGAVHAFYTVMTWSTGDYDVVICSDDSHDTVSYAVEGCVGVIHGPICYHFECSAAPATVTFYTALYDHDGLASVRLYVQAAQSSAGAAVFSSTEGGGTGMVERLSGSSNVWDAGVTYALGSGEFMSFVEFSY
jgi:hypothetical protein